MESKHGRGFGGLRTGLHLLSTRESVRGGIQTRADLGVFLDPELSICWPGPRGLLGSCTAEPHPEARVLHAGTSAWEGAWLRSPWGPSGSGMFRDATELPHLLEKTEGLWIDSRVLEPGGHPTKCWAPVQPGGEGRRGAKASSIFRVPPLSALGHPFVLHRVPLPGHGHVVGHQPCQRVPEA